MFYILKQTHSCELNLNKMKLLYQKQKLIHRVCTMIITLQNVNIVSYIVINVLDSSNELISP